MAAMSVPMCGSNRHIAATRYDEHGEAFHAVVVAIPLYVHVKHSPSFSPSGSIFFRISHALVRSASIQQTDARVSQAETSFGARGVFRSHTRYRWGAHFRIYHP